jgi:WD40 repeat protein
LDAGRIAEALKRLEATDPAIRGFEYEYLLARGNAANGQAPAPDLIRTIPTPDVDTRYGVLDKVNRRVAFICRDGTARTYDLKSPQAEPKLATHQDGGPIWSAAFSADGKTFVAGYQNGDVVVWDAGLWMTRHVISISDNKPVRTIAASPDGSAFVAEGESALELWSLAGDKPQKIADVGPRYNFGEGLAFSPQGDMIATGGMFDILLYNATTGEEVKTLSHASYTMGLEFSPDGKRIASAPRGNVNKMLAIFDIASGGPLFNAGPLEKHIDGLSFTPDGKRIIATGAQRSLRVFDTQSGTLLLNLDRATRTVNPAFSNDGRILGWFEATGYQHILLDAVSSGDE